MKQALNIWKYSVYVAVWDGKIHALSFSFVYSFGTYQVLTVCMLDDDDDDGDDGMMMIMVLMVMW